MNYVIIDFETTGLNYKQDQVIEMAAIKLDKDFNEISSFHTLVSYWGELPEFITNLTGIRSTDLKGAMTQSKAFEILKEFLKDSVVVAQHAPFDLSFLSMYDIAPPIFICTKSLTQQIEPAESSSLGPTCERLGIKLEKAHRAIDDARATGKVLEHRLKNNDGSLFVFNTLVVAKDRPLNFIPKSTQRIQTVDGELIADFGGRVK